MGASTLSKLQKAQYKEIVKLFGAQNSITLDDVTAIRMKETLGILELLGYIHKVEVSGGVIFIKCGNFADFDAWHKDKVREERQLSRREWYIAIAGAAIGAFIGLLPTIVPWLISLFTVNG